MCTRIRGLGRKMVKLALKTRQEVAPRSVIASASASMSSSTHQLLTCPLSIKSIIPPEKLYRARYHYSMCQVDHNSGSRFSATSTLIHVSLFLSTTYHVESASQSILQKITIQTSIISTSFYTIYSADNGTTSYPWCAQPRPQCLKHELS